MECRSMSRIFIHSKTGKKYELITDFALGSEDMREYVVYRALYGDNQVWVRPRNMFFEEVTIDGKKVPRFKEVFYE